MCSLEAIVRRASAASTLVLGRWGVITKVVGPLFEVFVTIVNSFPLTAAVTAKGTNRGIAMFDGTVILPALYCFVRGPTAYVGPVARVKQA